MGKVILKLVASLVLLVGLFAVTDTTEIFDRLKEADLAWLSVAFVCLTMLTFLMARRWQLTAHALDLDLGFWRAVGEYYLAQMVNLVLPGGVMGDAARAIRLRNEGDLLRAAQSVMLERLIGQATLFGMMLGGFVIVLAVPGGLAWPQWSWVLLGVSIIAMGCIGLLSRNAGSIAGFFRLFLLLIRQPQHIILSSAIAVIISIAFYACAAATGTGLPFSTLFTLIPLILTSMLIPLSVGGWGWREGAAAALFPLAGALPSAGIAAGIAYGAMMLLAALPGLGVLIFSKTKSEQSTIVLKQAENT